MLDRRIAKFFHIIIIVLYIVIPILELRFYYGKTGITKATVQNVEIVANGRLKLTYAYNVQGVDYVFTMLTEKNLGDMRIVYNKEKPTEHQYFTLSNIYFRSEMIIKFFMLIVFESLYRTLLAMEKKRKYEILDF